MSDAEALADEAMDGGGAGAADLEHEEAGQPAANEEEVEQAETEEEEAPVDVLANIILSKTLFLNEGIVQHLECSICNGVARLPYNLPNCGHSFCSACLRQDHKARTESADPDDGVAAEDRKWPCPTCRKEMPNTWPNAAALELAGASCLLLQSAQIRCPYFTGGCTHQLLIGQDMRNLRKHIEHECSRVACAEGSAVILRTDQADHAENWCPQRKIECVHCHQAVTAQDQQAHINGRAVFDGDGREAGSDEPNPLITYRCQNAILCVDACGAVVPIADRAAHADVCPHTMLPCALAAQHLLECGDAVQRESMLQHVGMHINAALQARVDTFDQAAADSARVSAKILELLQQQAAKQAEQCAASDAVHQQMLQQMHALTAKPVAPKPVVRAAAAATAAQPQRGKLKAAAPTLAATASGTTAASNSGTPATRKRVTCGAASDEQPTGTAAAAAAAADSDGAPSSNKRGRMAEPAHDADAAAAGDQHPG